MLHVQSNHSPAAVSALRNSSIAVDRVSFSVDKGEIVGFLGPNGALKTTTLRMIMGITAPDAGTITFHGTSGVPGGAIPKHRVGYLPEERGLYKEARVLDVLLFLSGIKGMPRDVARQWRWIG